MSGIKEWISPSLAVGSTVLNAGGQWTAASAVAQEGEERRRAAEFEALQLEQNALQAVAAAQRKAATVSKQDKLIQSRALAVAAASGASATDPTVVNIIAKTAGEGAYERAVAIYEGEEVARVRREAARATRYRGYREQVASENKAQALRTGALGSLLAGAGSLFAKYGFGGPSATPSPGSGSAGFDFEKAAAGMWDVEGGV